VTKRKWKTIPRLMVPNVAPNDRTAIERFVPWRNTATIKQVKGATNPYLAILKAGALLLTRS
jgi:hypothetical protein